MPCEYAYTVHCLNAGHHLAEFLTTRFLCAFRLLKFLKNFKIFFTRELTKLKKLSFNTHNLFIIVLCGLSRVEKIFWFVHICFWIIKKKNPLPSHFLLSCPPTEFAFACKTDSDFAHPLLLTARQRAGAFSDQVMHCAPGGDGTAHKALEEARFFHL